jgi:hypothetical protein
VASGAAGEAEREFVSRTVSAAGGAAAVVCGTAAAGNDKRGFGPRTADAWGTAAEVCGAAGDIVHEFVRRTTCGAARETSGVFGSAAVGGEIKAVTALL